MMMSSVVSVFAQASSSDASAGAGVIVAIIFLLFGLLFIVAIIAMLVLWIITLIHVIQHEDVPDRVLWIVLHLLVGSIIGPIYWLAVKKPYDKKHHHASK